MTDPEPSPPSVSAPQKPQSSALFWIMIGLFIALVGVASWALKSSLSSFELSNRQPLPVLSTLEPAFTAQERLGETRSLGELRGKVTVLAFTYSRCPHGCAGVAAQMLKLRDQFAGNADVHFISLAVWPETDTPEMLRAFAESIGVKENDPWWWLSTGRDAAWEFMTSQVGFEPSREIPPDERLNPEDFVAHDLRAVVIDRQLRVRAFYALMHPQSAAAEMAMEKLEQDITLLLQE